MIFQNWNSVIIDIYTWISRNGGAVRTKPKRVWDTQKPLKLSVPQFLFQVSRITSFCPIHFYLMVVQKIVVRIDYGFILYSHKLDTHLMFHDTLSERLLQLFVWPYLQPEASWAYSLNSLESFVSRENILLTANILLASEFFKNIPCI